MPDLTEHTFTFLFTDIEQSTRLWEEYPQQMPRALERHDEILLRTIGSEEGLVFKQTGDGFQAVFTNPVKALRCSVEAQKALYAENWQGISPLRARMAVHSGQAQRRGGDYYGPTLNRCHRLMSAAHGGQILVSSVTAELVRNSLPPDISLMTLGEYRLRDLLHPEVIYQVAHPDLPSRFPPIHALSTYMHNLPIQMTNFIGRENDLRDVLRRLSASRLVTLGGSGGVGKTRLAIHVGAEVLDRFPDGVWFVDLSTTQNPSFVPQTIALSLGLKEMPPQPLIDTIIADLKPKHLLLILDNCEHLIDAVASLVKTILTECRRVYILATSRERLQLPGEIFIRLPSLSAPSFAAPPPPMELLSYESVQLFIDRANSVSPGFTLTPENAGAIARICDLLDGIPLAIELAAARLTVLSVHQIAERLGQSFRLLASTWRTLPDRQKTLQTTIEWSYNLLTEKEKRLLERLSVFSGGFDLASVEAICADSLVEKEQVLDLLARLIEKSLLVVEEGTDASSGVRYRMLKTISAFGEEKLKERREEVQMHRNHLEYYLSLAENAEKDLLGSRQEATLKRLQQEHENILAALHWCVDSGMELEKALRLATAIWRYWLVRGILTEGRRLICDILDRVRERGSAPDDLIAKGYSAAGVLSWALAEYHQSEDYHQQALRIRQRLGDTVGIASSLSNLAITAAGRDDFPGAIKLLNEAADVLRDQGDPNYFGHILNNLAACYIETHNWQMALEKVQESLSIFRETGDLLGKATALRNLALIFANQNKTQAASDSFLNALDILSRLENTQNLLGLLCNVANFLKTFNLFNESVQLYSSVLNLSQCCSSPLSPKEFDELKSDLEAMKILMVEPNYTDAVKRGTQLTLEEAVGFARRILLKLCGEESTHTTEGMKEC